MNKLIASALLLGAMGTAHADIIGSGQLTEEFRPMEDIQVVELKGLGELTVERTDGEFGLWIEAESNLHPFILTSVDNGVLRISSDPEHDLHSLEPIRYHLKVEDIDRIHLGGNATFETPVPYVTNHLRVDVEEAAVASLDIQANALDVNIKDAAQVKTSGQVSSQTLSVKGEGRYVADALHSQKARIKAHDKANVTVDVSDDLDVTADGQATVAYRGGPRLHDSINEQAQLTNS